MKEITRDIVGAVIISADEKILLGHNQKGGVFEGYWVIPGGGIEPGETSRGALIREVLEETGIDVRDAEIIDFETVPTASTEKTDRNSGERVTVHMTFYDAVIKLQKKSDEIELKFEDDFAGGQWFTEPELASLKIAPPTLGRLREAGLKGVK